MGIDREAVLEAITAYSGVGEPFTSDAIAERLGVKEYQVRGAIGWLRAGGLIEVAGRVPRRDHRGKGYRARVYRWTGEERVARDPEQRRGRSEQRYSGVPREIWHLAVSAPWGGGVAEGVSTPVMLRRRPLTLSKCYPQRYPRGSKKQNGLSLETSTR